MIVLDTNVLSEAMKPAPDPAVTRWMMRERGGDLFRPPCLKPNSSRHRNSPGWPAQARPRSGRAQHPGTVRRTHSPVRRSSGPRVRQIVADRRRLGRPIDNLDAQIAAIARASNMSLATRDIQDFANAGVPIFDPWQL
jgi:predicted nucleic acid-binding protein